jgi:hypothetical protein
MCGGGGRSGGRAEEEGEEGGDVGAEEEEGHMAELRGRRTHGGARDRLRISLAHLNTHVYLLHTRNIRCPNVVKGT